MELKNIAILGDCMEYMASLPDNAYDLAVVDPPYGIGVNINMGRRKGGKKSTYHKFAGGDTSIPDANYFKELFRVSKNQIVWGGNYMTDHLKPSPCWLLWDKGFSSELTFAQFELAWTSFTSSSKKYDQNPSQSGRIHPTQKPVALYDWIFKHYAKPGQTILDTHLGSGSSRIAAHKNGLNFTGIELDPEYYHASVKRYEAYLSQQTLFDLSTL